MDIELPLHVEMRVHDSRSYIYEYTASSTNMCDTVRKNFAGWDRNVIGREEMLARSDTDERRC